MRRQVEGRERVGRGAAEKKVFDKRVWLSMLFNPSDGNRVGGGVGEAFESVSES